MSRVFATSMWKFCDAIVTYVADIDSAPDKTLSIESFSGEIFPIYELIFTNWLPSRESKVFLSFIVWIGDKAHWPWICYQVRGASIQAVGSMSAILTTQQLEQQLPKMLTSMLALYKKDKNHLSITMVSRLFYSSIRTMLMSCNDLSWLHLAGFMSAPGGGNARREPDALSTFKQSAKCFACASLCAPRSGAHLNQEPQWVNALLRHHRYASLQASFHFRFICVHNFENEVNWLACSGRTFTDDVVTFLLGRLDPRISKTPRQRMGTLLILKHLVTRLGNSPAPQLIMRTLTWLLT